VTDVSYSPTSCSQSVSWILPFFLCFMSLHGLNEAHPYWEGHLIFFSAQMLTLSRNTLSDQISGYLMAQWNWHMKLVITDFISYSKLIFSLQWISIISPFSENPCSLSPHGLLCECSLGRCLLCQDDGLHSCRRPMLLAATVVYFLMYFYSYAVCCQNSCLAY
jgi:hypothetical protein